MARGLSRASCADVIGYRGCCCERPSNSWSGLGPGLVTGAADDDPSGIATYSQVGGQFGFGLAWTMLFSFPLMVVIQEVSARIGCVTGRGIAKNLRRH